MRALVWLRSDLRLRDNAALDWAAQNADQLTPVFVLDERLVRSENTSPARMAYLLDSLERLANELAEREQRLCVRRGDPVDEIVGLFEEARAEVLVFHRDTSPYAVARDAEVARRIEKAGGRVEQRKDRVVFEGREVVTKEGRAYSVYTPYRRAWRARLETHPQPPAGPLRLPPPIPGLAAGKVPSLASLELGEPPGDLLAGGEAPAKQRLQRFLSGPVDRYAHDRDFPALDATSRLSAALRFGTISVRQCLEWAQDAADDRPEHVESIQGWVDQLIWRDFYAMILSEHPRVLREPYRREYDAMEWNDDEDGFAAWCEGRTGYPIVDAGMRQLRATGWMHNRLRMIVASFLTKDLLIDWRRGERFFMQQLVDGDPANNNGGWQWSASTGTDAQPYFRIFNPVSQSRRFDPDGRFIRRFVPELEALDAKVIHAPWEHDSVPSAYPAPIVDHASRRKQALERLERARAGG